MLLWRCVFRRSTCPAGSHTSAPHAPPWGQPPVAAARPPCPRGTRFPHHRSLPTALPGRHLPRGFPARPSRPSAGKRPPGRHPEPSPGTAAVSIRSPRIPPDQAPSLPPVMPTTPTRRGGAFIGATASSYPVVIYAEGARRNASKDRCTAAGRYAAPHRVPGLRETDVAGTGPRPVLPDSHAPPRRKPATNRAAPSGTPRAPPVRNRPAHPLPSGTGPAPGPRSGARPPGPARPRRGTSPRSRNPAGAGAGRSRSR